jgi:chemotaxis protein MotB
MTILAGLTCLVALSGCSSDLQKTNVLLSRENEDLRAQMAERNAALAENEAAMRDKDNEIARLQQAEQPYVQQPLAQVTGFEEIANISAAYSKGEVTVIVESDVLFSPGKTSLKTGAKRSLDQVSSVLARSYADQIIRIEGYTDSDPIRKSGYRSNYHLGFERAFAVREYLISHGVDPDRVSVASYGPTQAMATKAASRRVEIVVATE